MLTRHALVALLAAALAARSAAQTVLEVPADHATIQAAVVAASNGDTVLVSPGTYVETIDFLGKEIAVRSAGGPSVTAIDADGAGPVVTFASGEGRGAVLEGFVLTRGDPGASFDGGGVRCIGSGPTIRDCWIRFNDASDGAGVYLGGNSSAAIERCVFENNEAGGFGGGIDVVFSSATVVDCVFRDNSAVLDGGGVAVFQGVASIERCLFLQNDAGDEGGGVRMNGATGSIESCALVLNEANLGGGLKINGGSGVTVSGCMIGENTAFVSGGGIELASADPTIASCTLANNTASAFGGALNGVDASPVITNSIAWANAVGELTFSGASAPAVSFCDVQGGFVGVGNFNLDPVLANLAGGNLRLQNGSPCIEAGDDVAPGTPPEDFDRQPRIAGVAIDVGADEVHAESGLFLDRFAPTDCRLLCYNVWQSSIFASVNPAQAAKFARLVNALDPDVLCLQEVSFSAASVASLLDSIVPHAGGGSWFAHASPGSNDVIAAKYPLSLRATATIPPGERDLAMALVDLPDSLFGHDLYAINAHFKCCGDDGNDPERQQQADAITSWMRDARTPGGFIDLPPNTPIAVVGDFNIIASYQPVATLLNGDVQDEATYGPDSPPDWDGSAGVDLRPAHNRREPYTYTWRDDFSSFAPGRLDYVTYTDSVVRVGNSFVLNTGLMSTAELTASGLQVWDVTTDAAGEDYDHLPLVVDFRATEGPIHSYGVGCGGLVSGWTGTPSIGATVELKLFGAEPFEPVSLLVGTSDAVWLGIPLPLDLGLFGANGCQLLAAPQVQLQLAANSTGESTLVWNIPSDGGLVGTSLFTQWASLPATGVSDWTLSDALRVVVQP